ncbi:MAG: hypothetical protein ACRD19_09480, partial [Terriglobia bacterium]
PYTSLPRIREELNVYNASPLYFSPQNACKLFVEDPAANHRLATAWVEAIAHHPVLFFRWRFRVLKALLGLNSAMLQPYLVPCIVHNTQHITLVRSAFHRWVMGRLAIVAQSPIFRPYVYLIVLLLICGFGIWRKRRDLVLISAAGSFYILGYFIVSPGGVFRYICASVFITLVLWARIAAEWIEKRYPNASAEPLKVKSVARGSRQKMLSRMSD